jgi:hypothetical protein
MHFSSGNRPALFINTDERLSVCAGLLLFALFGIGFDTESTEPLFRIGSRVMD